MAEKKSKKSKEELDNETKELDKKIEDRAKRLADKEGKTGDKKPKPTEIKKPTGQETPTTEGSILDSVKGEIEQTPFVGRGGMWKAVTSIYNSCTDEHGRLKEEVGLDGLQSKVDSGRKKYFSKNFGGWKLGTQKGKSATIGDMVYREYLGDAEQVFHPLRGLSKQQLTPDVIMEKALDPLIGHFGKKMMALDQYMITSLDKTKKQKLKEEIVARSKAIDRPILGAELVADESLVNAVYGLISEERGKEYGNTRQGKSLLEGINYG